MPNLPTHKQIAIIIVYIKKCVESTNQLTTFTFTAQYVVIQSIRSTPAYLGFLKNTAAIRLSLNSTVLSRTEFDNDGQATKKIHHQNIKQMSIISWKKLAFTHWRNQRTTKEKGDKAGSLLWLIASHFLLNKKTYTRFIGIEITYLPY